MTIVACTAVILSCGAAAAQGPGSQESRQKKTQPWWNKTMKTFGGRQFWGDLHYFHGWRIQRNVYTKHCRLLDEDDNRHASGTFEVCLAKLKEIREDQELPAMDGRAVILVHGIVRSSKSFSALEKRLKEDGFTVFGFDYPSTRIPITESADYLKECVKSLEGIDEIYFVVHSMGGLVVRSMLMKNEDPRFKRMVMLGVPNMGAELADTLANNVIYKAIYGPAGQQLVTGQEGFIEKLPTPKFEFGVIAGARGTEGGYNPLIPGDDDGTVALSSTRLPGASDFMSRPVLHSFLMYNKECVECCSRFLEAGRFSEDKPPQPILREEKNKKPKASAAG